MHINRPILFNLTRLIDRQKQSHATGVDRVDIQHANLMTSLAKQGTKVIFVHQVKNYLSLIPDDEATPLIHALKTRWTGKKRQIENSFRHEIKKKKLNIPAKWHNLRERFISKNLEELILNLPPPIYINSGHSGLHHFKIHEHLKKEYQCDLVYYLHDLIPIDFPEYSASPSKTHMKRLDTVAKTGTMVFVNSQHTKNRFRKYCDNNNLPLPKIQILYIGVEQSIISAASKKKPRLADRYKKMIGNSSYFVAVGTIEPRKNYQLLLHIWREICLGSPKNCPKLLIIGKRGWRIENFIHMIEECSSIKNYVFELNDIPDYEMIPLVQNSHAMLFPSFEEGWGMPTAEALTLNTPVICSDIPVLKEATQNQAIYIHPLDAKKWIENILTDSNRGGVINNFQPNTWSEHNSSLAETISMLQSN